MNIEDFRSYCFSLPGVTEDTPFDETTLAMRMENKIFALTDIDNFAFINLKCDPEKAVELRDTYVEIQPGYHMNKRSWNSVYVTGSLSDALIEELISDSYYLIFNSLSKKVKEKIISG